MDKKTGGGRHIDILSSIVIAILMLFFSLVLFPSRSYADSLSISKDSYVNQAYPNTNYGSASVAYVGLTSSYSNAINRIFISFPFSRSYISLYLNLYCTGEDQYGSDLKVRIYPISADWAENTITWNNQPPYSTSYSVTYTFQGGLSRGKWHQIDITGLLPYWASNPFYGVVIVADPEVSNAQANHVNLGTRESGYPPYITYTMGLAPPTGLSANAIGPTQVELTWQPNTEPDLAGYIIYRDYVEIARVGANATSYTDSNVQPNTTYTYGIKAYNTSNLVSNMSNTVTVTTPQAPPPATPNSLTATALSTTQVKLTWQPNTEPDLAGYIIYRDYVEIARVGAGDTSYTDIGLSPNTTYTYGIKAYNIWGVISDMSNAATVTTPPSILAAPQGLTATALAYNQVQLNWQPNTDSGLAGYIIYRDYVEIARVGPNETTYVDNTVQPNTTYIYGVKAYDVNGNISDISNAATVTTPVAINAPKGLTATVISYNQVQLTWQPNTDPNLAGYIIYRDYIEIARVGATENTYIDNTVSPNTRYIYGIKAYSTDGFISDISNAATVTTPASPHPVITVRVDGRTIKISWTSSGSGFNYKVLINDTEVANVTKTSYDYSASGPGYYTVQIVAVSPSGEEFPSTKVGVTVSSIVSSYNMVTDVLQNTGAILLPTGGLLALYFGLKATPFLIEIVKTFIARRI